MRNRNIQSKLSKKQTKFIIATGKHCEACWKCVEACPANVIGKVGLWFHRHAIIRNAENCIGCYKCITACKYGVIGRRKLI